MMKHFGSLRQAVVGNFLGKLCSISLGLVSLILIARVLGPEAFGIYALVVVAVRLATIPVVEGTARLCVREISGSLATGEGGVARASARYAARMGSLLLFLGGSLTVAFLATNPALKKAVGAEFFELAFLSLLLLVLEFVTSYFRGLIRGVGRTVRAHVPDVMTAALIPTLVLGYLELFGELTPKWALALRALALCASIAVWSVMAFRAWPKNWRGVAPDPASPHWTIDTIQFAAIGLLQVAAVELSTVMLAYLSDARDVGIYRVVSRIYGIASFGPMVALMAFGPRIAFLWRGGRRGDLEDMAQLVTLGGAAASGIILAVIVVFGQPLILAAFGQAYAGAWLPAVMVCLAAFVNALFGPTARVLKMTGQQLWVTIGILTGVAAILSANFVLIPLYSVTGSALAFLIGLTISNVIFYVATRRQLGIDTFPSQRALRRAGYEVRDAFGK